MKPKTLFSLPILTITLAAAIAHFSSGAAHPLLTDIRASLAPQHRPDPALRSRKIDSFILAYKKDLHLIKESEQDNAPTDPPYNPDIAMDLRIAELHMKYADRISEQGFKWSEVGPLVYKADQSEQTSNICDNLGWYHRQRAK